MTNKQIMESIFNKYGIEWQVKEFDEYINPKPKTVSSILSKMQRLYLKQNNKENFTFFNSGINDLLRITIITEYKDVVPLIKKIKELFKDTTGHFKIKNSGYYGVHLHFYLEGVPCEIQLAPQLLVMAIDYLHPYYAKWRDFNEEDEKKFLEIKRKEILKNPNEKEKNILLTRLEKEKQVLNTLLQEKHKDLVLRKKIYHEVYELTHFALYKKDIEEAFKEINEETMKRNSLTDETLLTLFNRNFIKNGRLDKEKIQYTAEELLPQLYPLQAKLINMVKENVILDKENI